MDNPHVLASATDVGRLAGAWSWVRTAPDPALVMTHVAEIASRHTDPDGTMRIPQSPEPSAPATSTW